MTALLKKCLKSSIEFMTFFWPEAQQSISVKGLLDKKYNSNSTYHEKNYYHYFDDRGYGRFSERWLW